MFRALLSALAATTALTVVGAVLVPAPAADDEGGPTVRVSATTAVLGTPVQVSGKAPSLRRVVLQLETDQNGWQTVAGAHTGVGGGYSFRAPDWVGTHRLRVVVPATAVFAQQVSRTVSVRVRVPYRPKGSRSDWAWISDPGARWNPCRTITYRINPRGGYPQSVTDLRRTFAAVGKVTGFEFRYVGRTGARVRWNSYDYFPRGTDIVVDWQSPAQTPRLANRVAGIGGHWVLGKRRFDGYVVLDQTERLSREVWRQVMSHELGHVLGLGHASSRTQLMFGTSTQHNRLWGHGDLTALDRIGASQGCLRGKSTKRSVTGTGPVPVFDR